MASDKARDKTTFGHKLTFFRDSGILILLCNLIFSLILVPLGFYVKKISGMLNMIIYVVLVCCTFNEFLTSFIISFIGTELLFDFEWTVSRCVHMFRGFLNSCIKNNSNVIKQDAIMLSPKNILLIGPTLEQKGQAYGCFLE
jgi:hypothetical protein